MFCVVQYVIKWQSSLRSWFVGMRFVLWTLHYQPCITTFLLSIFAKQIQAANSSPYIYEWVSELQYLVDGKPANSKIDLYFANYCQKTTDRMLIFMFIYQFSFFIMSTGYIYFEHLNFENKWRFSVEYFRFIVKLSSDCEYCNNEGWFCWQK